MLASQCKTVAVPRALTLRLHSTLWSFQSSRWCAFEQYARGLHDAQSLVAFFPHTTLTHPSPPRPPFSPSFSARRGALRARRGCLTPAGVRAPPTSAGDRAWGCRCAGGLRVHVETCGVISRNNVQCDINYSFNYSRPRSLS